MATDGDDGGNFVYEDLLGDTSEDYSRYFDPGEFAAREHLEEGHYWHRHRRQLILELLKRERPQPRHGIELGCGTGSVATHLNRHGIRVDYADVHREGLSVARRRARRVLQPPREDPVRFIRLDVSRQFPFGEYDFVLLLDVLEHLPDAHCVLRGVRRHVPSGAVLLFTVPAFSFLWSTWDDVQRHQRRYTRAMAGELARSTGFRVSRLTYFFFPLIPAACAVKGLRALNRWLRRSTAERPFTQLVESRSPSWLGAPLGAVLALERRWLLTRSLPVGTSVLCLAHAA